MVRVAPARIIFLFREFHYFAPCCLGCCSVPYPYWTWANLSVWFSLWSRNLRRGAGCKYFVCLALHFQLRPTWFGLAAYLFIVLIVLPVRAPFIGISQRTLGLRPAFAFGPPGFVHLFSLKPVLVSWEPSYHQHQLSLSSWPWMLNLPWDNFYDYNDVQSANNY